MPRRSLRHRRHSIHPSNNENNNNNAPATNQNLLPPELQITITDNPLVTTTITAPDGSSHSSIQSAGLGNNDDDDSNKTNRRDTATSQLISNLIVPSPRNTHSLLAKLTDAKKTLFGRATTPDPAFSSAEANKALLSYILSEPFPQLDVIQGHEREGAQLNAVTEEGNTAIHLLARAEQHSQESLNIVEYFIKKGCDPNRQNDYGWTAAHYALATHNTDLVIYLLKVMIDVNLPTWDTYNGYPSQTQLLHIAARQNDSVLIRLLVKTYKARVNVYDEDGCTPLQICCYEDNIDALKALLETDADFQKGTRLNPHETPVSILVKYQYDMCLKALFELTSNFNWKRYFSQLPRSPLLCDFPSIYGIELLVERSLDIDACDERGNTFLHYLVNKKDIDYDKYVEKLIQASADFNRQNRLGRTPFLEALEQKNFELIAVFLRHIEVTNIHIVDSLSNTALHYCKYLDQLSIYEKVLQSNPQSLNAQNRDGQTPLHDAILCNNDQFATYLIQHKADLSLINKEGNTPLHLIAINDNVKMCRLLMKRDIDVIPVNKMGKIPLHLACAHEKPNVVNILINKMKIEDINLVDRQGRTPLHECAENTSGSLARYLIRHGADENANDSRNNTVLHLVTEKGNLELVSTLIKSSHIDINQLNADSQSPLGLAILYNHDEISQYLLNQENIRVQFSDLKMAMKMNNYEMVKLLIEKDRNCLRVRSSAHGDMIIHIYMRRNFNNLVCLETLLSFISDNELLTYLSESSLTFGDSLLHIAAREDTPNALTCFLNLSRVKFWFWANMMLTKNNDNKTPLELANEFKHYAIIKLINSKWKESYEHLSHSLRDGHCGVSPTGVTQARRRCFNCNQTGFTESSAGQVTQPCAKCNVCLYKSLDNSMQVFLALLFSDESSTIALDIMDSLIVVNEVQKAIHLYLDHIEPWEEFDKTDLSESSSLLNQLIHTADSHKQIPKSHSRDPSVALPIVQTSTNPSTIPIVGFKSSGLSANANPIPTPTGSSLLNAPGPATHPPYSSRPSITAKKFRPDGTQYRAITPLEAIYYHERLDLVTHPLIKGLIKWKWDNYAAKHFYLGLLFETLFLISWTCISLITPFPVRYVYRFPQDIWRVILWAISIGFLLWEIVREMFDISYARKRYEDYVIWESERTQNRLDLMSKNKYKPNTTIQSSNAPFGKTESIIKTDNDIANIEHSTINETIAPNLSSNISLTPMRSHHSQHHPLPPTLPTVIKGKPIEPLPNQQQPIDAPLNSTDPSNTLLTNSKKKSAPNVSTTIDKTPSRFVRFFQRIKASTKTRFKSYYMYYSLNNLFDWIIFMFCLITTITHFVDVASHTVVRARIHMYVASVTVLSIWFRFMVFFRTISITLKTLRSKFVEIKLGELLIMVRMMFDDIIRFLFVFIFLLAPYALVFFFVFGGRQIPHSDYEQNPKLCEDALLYCPIVEGQPLVGDNSETRTRYMFNGTSSNMNDFCYNATNSCRVVEQDGFEDFYALLFSIFRIALVDNIPIEEFNLIDRYFSAFVCGTYLLFTAILSINIFIGLISNALQTEAFSTVEARFLLERIEVILNYEWRLSVRRRLQLQEIVHRQCAPLQLNWKEINFDAFGQTREEQQAKAFMNFRQTIEKHNIQFDTFRIQVQQKLSDIDTTLIKLQPTTTMTTQKSLSSSEINGKKIKLDRSTSMKSPPSSPNGGQFDIPQTPPIFGANESTANIFVELTRLRELLEDTLAGQTDRIPSGPLRAGHGLTDSTTASRRSVVSLPSRPQLQQQQQIDIPSTTEAHSDTQIQPFAQNLNERVTDLQLAVNRLHQDVSAIRHVIERMSPLSASLILGRATTGRR
ncbi:unnamed protein product [Adineta steineri]|uniref:Ion transport domain-containing protein n=1 Tax=Adineta steineri TaxID=433720 RepID=A0A819T222_9BILA|nr:unnamed protein product [Adineta steineri]